LLVRASFHRQRSLRACLLAFILAKRHCANRKYFLPFSMQLV
jgi:hypothetical protein